LLEKLELSPILAQIKHPTTHQNTAIFIDINKLNGVLHSALYTPHTRRLVPYALHELANNNLQPIVGLMSAGHNNSAISQGMYMSVVCSEDWPFITAEQRGAGELKSISQALFNSMDLMCPQWQVKAQKLSPLSQDKNIPSLILSGHFDPATPPSWGEELMQQLTNARHVIAPFGTHSISLQTCGKDLIADFINGVSVNELATQCMDDERELAIYTGPNGGTL
jgi:pimeloyl-ACP methyl ester carboxylesterase